MPSGLFYYNPVKVISGSHCAETLGHLIPHEANVLLVCSQGGLRRGYGTLLQNSLLSARHEKPRIFQYDTVEPNPSVRSIEDAASDLCNKNIQYIVSIGGGSVIDSAKILSVLLGERQNINQLRSRLLSQADQKWRSSLPVIAVPTTAGTGAEVTPFATIWDNELKQKFSVQGDAVYPKIALLDPALTRCLPYQETLYTALDTISHALESLWNKNRTAISTSLACQALTLSAAALPKLLNIKKKSFRELPDEVALDKRSQLMEASALAGMAISQTRTALAHAISYPLTLEFGVPHGLACSFTLPKLLIKNSKLLTDLTNQPHLVPAIGSILEEISFHTELERYASQGQLFELFEKQTLKADRLGNFCGDFGNSPIELFTEALS